MVFFKNMKQRPLTPCLHRKREVLQRTDLASSRLASLASSTVSDREFLDQGRCPSAESGRGKSEPGQQPVAFDAGSTKLLSQASLHLLWVSCLGCHCL